jgi:hypothetical protein
MERAVVLLVVMATLGSSSPVGQEIQCFTRYVEPGGWTIPKHAKAVTSGPYKRAGAPHGITFTEFALNPRTRIGLPNHYVEDRALVMLSHYWYSDRLMRLEVAGRPFAYTMHAKGVFVGAVGDVWWVDRDGSGLFTELSWGFDFAHLPAWVARRLAER